VNCGNIAQANPPLPIAYEIEYEMLDGTEIGSSSGEMEIIEHDGNGGFIHFGDYWTSVINVPGSVVGAVDGAGHSTFYVYIKVERRNPSAGTPSSNWARLTCTF